MKLLILYIFPLVALLFTDSQDVNNIVKALKANNISYVNEQLDSSIEITLNGKNNTYNKAQASKFLNDFFSGIKILDFKVLHQSESGGSSYCIGNLLTSDGNYRMTFFTREKSGKVVLQEIRMEKQ